MRDITDDLLLSMLRGAEVSMLRCTQDQGPCGAEDEADEEFDAVGSRQWLEDQIIDAESVALRLGYGEAAALLARALDCLAWAPLPASVPKAPAHRGVVLPFPASRQSS